jgi:hypothetical protein
MSVLFTLSGAVPHDPEVGAWFAQGDALRLMLSPWYAKLRGSGEGVCEVLHDGYPTVCLGGAAFAYVDAFKAHANVGFFHGVDLPDPEGLLQGTGKRMRHVKLTFGRPVNDAALDALIAAAYRDISNRLAEPPR